MKHKTFPLFAADRSILTRDHLALAGMHLKYAAIRLASEISRFFVQLSRFINEHIISQFEEINIFCYYTKYLSFLVVIFIK